MFQRKRDGNFKDREIHCEGNVSNTAKNEKCKHLMLMLGLNDIIDQLAVASSVHGVVMC